MILKHRVFNVLHMCFELFSILIAWSPAKRGDVSVRRWHKVCICKKIVGVQTPSVSQHERVGKVPRARGAQHKHYIMIRFIRVAHLPQILLHRPTRRATHARMRAEQRYVVVRLAFSALCPHVRALREVHPPPCYSWTPTPFTHKIDGQAKPF